MKHEKIRSRQSDTPIPGLSDKEIEARVFRNLEAKQRVWKKEQDNAVVIFQYPDNRSVYQRLAAWWHLRKRRSQSLASDKGVEAIAEPAWHGHWATVKYL